MGELQVGLVPLWLTAPGRPVSVKSKIAATASSYPVVRRLHPAPYLLTPVK